MRARSTERGLTSGWMEALTREAGSTIRFVDLGRTHGQMVGSMRANGATITCMAAESTPGQTADVMKVTTRTIRNMVLGNILGQMVVNTKEPGKMESSTDKESTSMQMATVEQESGSMVKELLGSITSE